MRNSVCEGRLVRVQRVQGMKPGQCKGSQAQEYTFDHTAAILTATTQRLERVLCRAIAPRHAGDQRWGRVV